MAFFSSNTNLLVDVVDSRNKIQSNETHVLYFPRIINKTHLLLVGHGHEWTETQLMG